MRQSNSVALTVSVIDLTGILVEFRFAGIHCDQPSKKLAARRQGH